MSKIPPFSEVQKLGYLIICRNYKFKSEGGVKVRRVPEEYNLELYTAYKKASEVYQKKKQKHKFQAIFIWCVKSNLSNLVQFENRQQRDSSRDIYKPQLSVNVDYDCQVIVNDFLECNKDDETVDAYFKRGRDSKEAGKELGVSYQEIDRRVDKRIENYIKLRGY